MNKNYIIVENIKTEDLIKILTDFTGLYKNTGVFEIEAFHKRDNTSSFLVTIDDWEFDLFAYLINYIRYPEGFGKSFVPGITGFYRVIDGSPLAGYKGGGEWVMVYISKNDADYVNVNFANAAGESYIYEFSGDISSLDFNERPFYFSGSDMGDYVSIMKFSGSPQPKKRKPWWNFW